MAHYYYACRFKLYGENYRNTNQILPGMAYWCTEYNDEDYSNSIIAYIPSVYAYSADEAIDCVKQLWEGKTLYKIEVCEKPTLPIGSKYNIPAWYVPLSDTERQDEVKVSVVLVVCFKTSSRGEDDRFSVITQIIEDSKISNVHDMILGAVDATPRVAWITANMLDTGDLIERYVVSSTESMH